MFVFRLCLAASFAGKNAETLLGPLGHRIKHIFEKTACARLILRVCITDARRIIGIGGQALVLHTHDQGHILKYNYVMAGSDQNVLRLAIQARQVELRELQLHLGDMTVHTEYFIAALPARQPMGQLLTICARQQRLGQKIDIFDPAAQQLIEQPTHAKLRRDIADLAANIRQLMAENYWLDIIGPENVVVALDGHEPRLKVIDVECYTPEYMDDVNPVLGRSYREVFFERLGLLEDMAASHSALPEASIQTAIVGVAPAAA